MKYTPARTLLPTGNYFSHGDNLRGEHVDCIGELDLVPYEVGYFRFIREASEDEIKKYCLEK